MGGEFTKALSKILTEETFPSEGSRTLGLSLSYRPVFSNHREGCRRSNGNRRIRVSLERGVGGLCRFLSRYGEKFWRKFKSIGGKRFSNLPTGRENCRSMIDRVVF